MNSLSKIISISSGAFVTIVALIFFLIKPTLADISSLHKQSGQQNVQLKQLQDQIRAYSDAKSVLANLSGKDEIANAIVPRVDLADAVSEVESAANNSGVTESLTITDVASSGTAAAFVSDDSSDSTSGTTAAPAKPKSFVPNEKTIAEIPYTLTTTGDFQGTLEFLQYLEHLPHFTEVTGLTFNTTVASNNSTSAHASTVLATINGVFFIQK